MNFILQKEYKYIWYHDVYKYRSTWNTVSHTLNKGWCDRAETAARIFYRYVLLYSIYIVLTAYYTTIYTLDFTGHIGVFKEVSFHVLVGFYTD